MIIVFAIGVTTGLFLLLAGILLVAERRLANYGNCRVTVNDGETEFEQPGGTTVLAALADHKIFIPSACGGKGSCGYCKVNIPSGGGQVLPTETPYLSRGEQRSGMRLACQVKVKSDIEIRIPDFLDTVRAMVANKTFNAKARWKWTTTPDKPVEYEPLVTAIPENDTLALDRIIEPHRTEKGGIIPILQQVNHDFGYLPEPLLRRTSDRLKLPVSRIYSLATFYNSFRLTAKGENVIRVCMGTACHVKGANNLLQNLQRTLGIACGETTPDGLFTLEEVRCLGCCALAPVMMINEDLHGEVTQAKLPKILKRYYDEAKAEGASHALNNPGRS